MIAPLDRKLFRDLARMRGQIITIAMVIAAGIASYIALRSAYRSLLVSRDAYYAQSRFGDVFASVRRAPRTVADRLRAIPGVAQVETRIVEDALLDLDDMPEPATARVVSVTQGGETPLDRLHLRTGRFIEPGRADEVLVSEAFALAHRLQPGDSIRVLLNGRRTRMHIVGIALSPEYIYVVPPGEFMPDDRRYGVLWLDPNALEAPFAMEGAFDDLVISVSHDASVPAVIAACDRILQPYGAFGAYDRERQMSARFLAQELKQLESYANFVPAIFLAVAAFLVNVVLARTIGTQREQLAALKALGFTNTEIALHYVKFVLVVGFAGALPGILVGAWAGRAMTRLYAHYFRFPSLGFELGVESVATAVIVSVAAALIGSVMVIRRATRLAPAEAMRPEAPPSFKPTLLDRLGVTRLFSHPARMIIRDMQRRALRTALATIGIAFSIAIIIGGRFSFDAVEYLIEVQFRHAARQDLTISFTHAVSPRARHEIASLPGVLVAEASRSLPVRVHHGRFVRETMVTGVDPRATLRRVFDQRFRLLELAPEGLALSRTLADRLHVRVGDRVEIEPLEDDRRLRTVEVTQLVDDFLGQSGYMQIAALHRLLDEEDLVSDVAVTVDPRHEADLLRRLKRLPNVLGVARASNLVRFFRDQMAQGLIIYTVAIVIFSSIIAVGVVYNSARIALALRSRELASLRVLGFTRGEVASVLIGEQMTQVVLSIVPGALLGTGLGLLIQRTADPELFRFPFVLSSRSYAFAVLVVFGAGLASALLVRRRANHLDMIAVLKARD